MNKSMHPAPTGVGESIRRANTEGRCAFIPYITVGAPTLEVSLAVIQCLEELGADVIELGVPFSDPVADGPTIQRSSERALAEGVTLRRVLEEFSRRPEPRGGARLLFSYFNPILQYGIAALPAALRDAGIGAVLISDLIPEEAAQWLAVARENAIECSFLAAITSDPERLKRVAAASSAFIYCISTTGVTGARETVDGAALRTVRSLRGMSDLPVAVGFGIRSTIDVRRLATVADAVVVGSALIDAIGDTDDPGVACGRATAFALPLLEACRR
jgi:tryptophan synthase alpha chain